MKLTDRITADRVRGWTKRLIVVALAFGAIALVLRLLDNESSRAFGMTALVFAMFAMLNEKYIWTNAADDDRRIAANAQAGPGEPLRRVGTAPWAYWGLGFALLAIALMFAAALIWPG